MNKWMKLGITGAVIFAGATAPAEPTNGQWLREQCIEAALSIDPVDLAGGSKLKDCGLQVAEYEMEQAYEMFLG